MVAGKPSPNNRFLCIHGHFYQPPRENPWLEAVETQDSAAPYHDWNERITAECYATNGAARIVDEKNRIVRMVNNYAHMSFNFGPTLLSWLEVNAPLTYRSILDADRQSQEHFGGHGSALAQVYNHVIMPLATRRDRETQIRWGIADFEHRFGRKPEGMWLAETAADTETLEMLAENGIRFTVLSPFQCARVRPLPAGPAAGEASADGDGHAAHPRPWRATPDGSVDTSRPYLARFNSGASIALFFYNGPLSRAIAFEHLLNSGDDFARRLLSGFRQDDPTPQLVHVATDGESYGHHHRHGEMALAYATQRIEAEGAARITNYGEFLELCPPTAEAEIVEGSSWSCFHGIERWRNHCGCNGGVPGYTQEWRAPLRSSLDWLRDAVTPGVDAALEEILTDAQAARNDYIHVILDRSRANVDTFFSRHATRTLSQCERTRTLALLEIARNAQLMYTSCGWFFDDLAGIETVQIIAYAARVIELAAAALSLDKADLERGFIERLSAARSNVPTWPDGGFLYEQQVQPMAVDLEQVAAHYAISSAFDNARHHPETGKARVFCYNVDAISERTLHFGSGQLVLGRAQICSELTERSAAFIYSVLHFGDHNITAMLKPYSPGDEAAFQELEQEAEDKIAAADLPALVRLVDDSFAGRRYSLTSLFRDEQRRTLDCILQPTLSEVEDSLAHLYTAHASLLHYLSRTGLPKPASLRVAAQIAINAQLRRAIEAERIDSHGILDLLSRARTDMVVLDTHSLERVADERMRQAMLALCAEPRNALVLENALSLAKTLGVLPFAPNLWQAQNLWYRLARNLAERDSGPGFGLPEWQERFKELGAYLSFDTAAIRRAIRTDHLRAERPAGDQIPDPDEEGMPDAHGAERASLAS